MEPATCPQCGRPVIEASAETCPACGANLAAQAAPGGVVTVDAEPPPPQPSGNSVPFEDSSQPFLQRFFSTVGMAFSNPVGLFSSMPSGDLGAPLVYGVIVGTITGVVAIVWNLMFGGLAMLVEGVDAGEFAIGTGIYVLILFLMPFFALLGLFVSSAIYHVALLILGDGQRGFSVTFRAVAYGNTPNLLAVIPLCGGFAGGIWALVLVIIGGKIGHGTDWWRAILAYFLPTIICCCLMTWLLMTLGVFGAIAN